MGTFEGHSYVGVPYLILGSWYIVQSLRRLYQCRIRGVKFVSSMGFPADFFPGRFRNLPIDSILKVGVPCGYIITELTYGYTAKPKTESHMNNWQHVTISFPLILSGVTELLLHYGVPIMDSWDYAANGCFFLVETMVFYFHLHGRSLLEQRLHVLFILAVVAALMTIVIEAKSRRHVMMPLMRGTAIFLKGTWITEIGFVLYNPFGPSWDENMHMNLTLATIHFSWHAIGCMLGAMMRFISQLSLQALSNDLTATLKRPPPTDSRKY
ncbi:transmembrane protein 45b [Plakobranchus ocellatus]|uniref:Transmembrane protein 45b n=1 Tax=Plakobranchus ocellatus TaxID=259542 RepID=A0AAV4CXY5_9GAST|nr:transmembrane protein 45b [Plakobranchus ocellatus]